MNFRAISDKAIVAELGERVSRQRLNRSPGSIVCGYPKHKEYGNFRGDPLIEMFRDLLRPFF